MSTRQEAIREQLSSAFSPVFLEILNESDNHAGPPGRESHFRVRIVSDAFEGKNLVARHRAVNGALASQLAPGGVHALAIEAWTPAQWEARGGQGNASPDCAGKR